MSQVSPFDVLGSGLPTFSMDGYVPINQRRWENPPGTMVSRALDRGRAMINQNLGSAVEGVGNVTGIDALQTYGAGVVDRNRDRIQRSAEMETGSPLQFVTGLLGENAPQLVASLGLPLAGAAIGALGGPAGMAAGFKTGLAAAGGFNYSMLAGEMRERQKDVNEEAGLGRTVNEGRAFGAAVPAALLETVSGALQARLLSSAVRRGGGRSITGAAARGAVAEGPTEAGQEAIVRAQAGQSLTDMEAVQEMALAGLAGMILGGTIGGAGRAVGRARDALARTGDTEQDLTNAIAEIDSELAPKQQPMLALPAPEPQPEQLALPAPERGSGLALPSPADFEAPGRAADAPEVIVPAASPEQLPSDAERAIAETQAAAKVLGLRPNSAFFKNLTAENVEQLYDQVLDGVDRAANDQARPGEGDLNRSLARIYERIGGGRDFDAEIQQATARRDELAQTRNENSKNMRAFNKARQDVVELQTQREMWEAALARKAERDQAAAVAVVAETQAQMDTERRAEMQARAERVQQAEAEMLAEEQAEAGRNTLMQDRLREALQQRQQEQDAQARTQAFEQIEQAQQPQLTREQAFEAAEAQRREDQVREAERAQAVQRAEVQQREFLVRQERAERAVAAEVAIMKAQDEAPGRRAQERGVARANRSAIERAAQALNSEPVTVTSEAGGDRSVTLQLSDGSEARMIKRGDMWEEVGGGALSQNRDEARDRLLSRRNGGAPLTMRGGPAQPSEAAGPVQVRDVQRRGNAAEIALSNGDAVRLTQRKGGWYEGDQLVGRSLDEAQRTMALRAERDRAAADGVDPIDMAVRRYRTALRPAAPQNAAPAQRVSPPSPALLPMMNVTVLNRSIRDLPDARMIVANGDNLLARGHLRRIESALRNGTRGWRGPYPVTIIANPIDLHDFFSSGIPAAQYERLVLSSGFVTPDGRVAINAWNVVDPQEALATYYHEVLGHVGMRHAFGDARAEMLERLYETNKNFRDAFNTWRAGFSNDLFARTYGTKPRWVQYEEVLANMSEGGPVTSTIWERLSNIVRDFARRMGFDVALSDAEIRAILVKAHEKAMEAGAPETQMGVEGGAQPARNPRGPVATPREIADAAKSYRNVPLATEMLRVAANATSGLPQTPKGMETALGRIMQIANAAAKRLTSPDMRENMRGAAVFFQTLNHLTNQYGRLFEADGRNYLNDFKTARDLRASLREILSRVGTGPIESYYKLSQTERADTSTLMSATFYQLDVNKDLSAHNHLTQAERARLKPIYDRMIEAKNRLAKNNALKVYEQMRASLDAQYIQQHTLDLYGAIRANRDFEVNIPSAQRNPLLDFMDFYKTNTNPAAIRSWWQKRLDAMTAETEAFIQRQGREPIPPRDQARVQTLLLSLQDQLQTNKRNIEAMEAYPYFHVGRFGRYSATFSVRAATGPDGRTIADPRATEVIAEELAKIGLDNVVVNEYSDGPVVFLRTDSRETAEKVDAIARRLAQQGIVDPSKKIGFDTTEPLAEVPESARRSLDATLRELQAMHAPLDTDSPEIREAKIKYVQRVTADMRQAFLNRLPDRSIAKVMARRGFRAGFDNNMMRAHATRMEAGANAGAAALYTDMAGEAIQGMSDIVRQASSGDPQKWAKDAVLRELLAREETAPDTAATSFVDAMRTMNHNYFLAWNPGYWLTQFTQLATNVVPEFVKNGVSFKDGSAAIMQTFPVAMQVIKATLADAKQRGFLEHGADATATADVIAKVKFSDDPKADAEIRDFINTMMNRGVIDIGSASRELGRMAEGRSRGAFDTTMRWAASSSYYLEVLGRLNAALAARQIAQQKGMSGDAMVDFSVKVIDEAMLNYSESNRARAFSRKGVVGEYTPLATAFLSFPFMMIEKYMREFGTAIGADTRGTEGGRAARRWLGSHLAVMGLLAGSLGLPFVTVIARAIDALGDLLSDDEEPFNVQIAYRNFLADTFGEDVGEVLARGLPRAIGFDVSSRIGAADIMPFSRLIADRRDWETALKDAAFDTFGSSLSMVQGVISGSSKVLSGDVVSGLQEALPLGLRNPISAYRMTTEGMVDRRGNLLPLEPGPLDIAWQLVGLTPARRAEYSEANFAQLTRQGVTGRTATNLRRAAAKAVEAGDREAFQQALDRIRQFDAGVDPGMQIMPGLATAISQTLQRRQLAQQLSTPLGVRPQDLTGIAQARFANY